MEGVFSHLAFRGVSFNRIGSVVQLQDLRYTKTLAHDEAEHVPAKVVVLCLTLR
jgi:hypothetical protein